MDLVNYIEVIDKNTLAIGCLGALLATISVISLGTVNSVTKLEINHTKEKNQIMEISKSLEEIKKDVEAIEKLLEEKNKNAIECNNCEKEANKDDSDANSDADSDNESVAESSEYNYKLPTELEKILHYIKYADDKTIETIVETCAGNRSIIVPNWYTKKDLEALTANKISQKKWEALYDNVDDLIDSTNALVVQWHENFEENNLMSDSEESDDEDDQKLNKSDAILEESDDESEINSDILKDKDSDSDSDVDIESELFNKLMKLKYQQLKQISGTNNNSLSKANLATKIVSSNKVSEIEQKLKKYL